MTLGPRGRSVAIERSYGAPQVTFDGVSVAKEIELEDKYENLGAQFLKQAADKTADNVGDGTTTSVVMEKVGKDGVVTVDDSNAIGNSYEVVEGMQFDRGYISAYMITDQERMEAVLENPYILVT